MEALFGNRSPLANILNKVSETANDKKSNFESESVLRGIHQMANRRKQLENAVEKVSGGPSSQQTNNPQIGNKSIYVGPVHPITKKKHIKLAGNIDKSNKQMIQLIQPTAFLHGKGYPKSLNNRKIPNQNVTKTKYYETPSRDKIFHNQPLNQTILSTPLPYVSKIRYLPPQFISRTAPLQEIWPTFYHEEEPEKEEETPKTQSNDFGLQTDEIPKNITNIFSYKFTPNSSKHDENLLKWLQEQKERQITKDQQTLKRHQAQKEALNEQMEALKKQGDVNRKQLASNQAVLDILKQKLEKGELDKDKYEESKQKVDENIKYLQNKYQVIIETTEQYQTDEKKTRHHKKGKRRSTKNKHPDAIKGSKNSQNPLMALLASANSSKMNQQPSPETQLSAFLPEKSDINQNESKNSDPHECSEKKPQDQNIFNFLMPLQGQKAQNTSTIKTPLNQESETHNQQKIKSAQNKSLTMISLPQQNLLVQNEINIQAKIQLSRKNPHSQQKFQKGEQKEQKRQLSEQEKSEKMKELKGSLDQLQEQMDQKIYKKEISEKITNSEDDWKEMADEWRAQLMKMDEVLERAKKMG